jgi:hypothetical protein
VLKRKEESEKQLKKADDPDETFSLNGLKADEKRTRCGRHADRSAPDADDADEEKSRPPT